MDSTTTFEGYNRFLRFGHILGAALREILEVQFLDGKCTLALNRGQFCSLKLIALEADLTVGELARRVGISSAACTKNVDKLVDLGLITRTVSTVDRREILLAPSPAGRRLVEEFEDLQWKQVAPVIDRLGQDKAEQLCNLLEEVSLGLLKTGSPLSDPCIRCSGYYQPDCSVASLHGNCTLRVKRRARTRMGDRSPAARRLRTAGSRVVKGSER